MDACSLYHFYFLFCICYKFYLYSFCLSINMIPIDTSPGYDIKSMTHFKYELLSWSLPWIPHLGKWCQFPFYCHKVITCLVKFGMNLSEWDTFLEYLIDIGATDMWVGIQSPDSCCCHFIRSGHIPHMFLINKLWEPIHIPMHWHSRHASLAFQVSSTMPDMFPIPQIFKVGFPRPPSMFATVGWDFPRLEYRRGLIPLPKVL